MPTVFGLHWRRHERRGAKRGAGADQCCGASKAQTLKKPGVGPMLHNSPDNIDGIEKIREKSRTDNEEAKECLVTKLKFCRLHRHHAMRPEVSVVLLRPRIPSENAALRPS
ncbi:MAG: hypothetical protein ABSE53_14730 [Terracidiphilus sp.]